MIGRVCKRSSGGGVAFGGLAVTVTSVQRFLVALFVMSVFATVAQAATPEENCLKGRAKAVGKYTSCLLGEISKFWGAGGESSATAYDTLQTKADKCVIKLSASWVKLQIKSLQSLGVETCDQNRFV